jgi:hypothetical protein
VTLKRFVQLRPAIDDVTHKDSTLSSLQLTLDSHDWQWIEKLVDVLEIFVEPVTLLSASSYPTLAAQYPWFAFVTGKLKKKLDDLDESGPAANVTLYNACIDGWNKLDRYHKLADQTSPAGIATLLDPKCKAEALGRLGWKRREVDRAKQQLRAVYNAQYAPNCGSRLDQYLTSVDAAARGRLQRQPSPPELTEFERSFLDPYNAESEQLPEPELVQPRDEVAAYLAERPAPPRTDALSWWRQHVKQYPRLAQMALDYHSIPATSVPSEQAFSRASDLITKKRNRMEPSSAEQHLCLRYWLGLQEATDEEVQGEDADLERRLAAAEARGRQAAAAMPEGSPGPVVEDHDVAHQTRSSSLSSVD